MPQIPRSDKPEKSTALPYIVPPSKKWDLENGQWSTFNLNIGSTEPQIFRALIGTSYSQAFVPAAKFCEEQSKDREHCAESRGVEPFQGKPSFGFIGPQRSKDWNEVGGKSWDHQTIKPYYTLGIDTISIGSTASNYSAAQQYVGAVTDDRMWLGQLGLGYKEVKPDSPKSFLQSLRDQDKIPSLSYGYTPGSYLRNHLASLTLGGYDQNRIQGNGMKFDFDKAAENPLSIPLQSIQVDGADVSEYHPQTAVIDSTLPYIWLPEEVCDSLANLFGLKWLDDQNIYYMGPNIDRKSQLKRSLTFKFGMDAVNFVNIKIPLEELEQIWTDNSTQHSIKFNAQYIPLKKLKNKNAPMILGRALLQQAYIVVDYDKSNFALYQSVNVDSVPEPKIIPIVVQGSTPEGLPDNTSPKSSLPTGAKAGIAVGCILVVIAIGAWFLFRWYKKRQDDEDSKSKHISYEIAGKHLSEIEAGMREKYEMEASGGGDVTKQKVPSYEVYEVDAYEAHELGTGSLKKKKSQLSDDKIVPAPAPTPPQELPA